jgi:hypothetical protein|eukprot:COSAG01_NODE_287_length_19408_cov_231.791703_22_plen_69_part_00
MHRQAKRLLKDCSFLLDRWADVDAEQGHLNDDVIAQARQVMDEENETIRHKKMTTEGMFRDRSHCLRQ